MLYNKKKFSRVIYEKLEKEVLKMSERLEEIKKKLEKYGQEHLLMFYDKMNEE